MKKELNETKEAVKKLLEGIKENINVVMEEKKEKIKKAKPENKYYLIESCLYDKAQIDFVNFIIEKVEKEIK